MSDEKPQVVDKRRFNQPQVEFPANVDPDTYRVGPIDQASADLAELHRPPSFSPSANPDSKHGLMDFTAAIKSVLEGKRVTRLEWNNPDIFLFMFMWGQMNPDVPAGKYLSIHNAEGHVHPLYMSDGDMLGDDWVEVV